MVLFMLLSRHLGWAEHGKINHRWNTSKRGRKTSENTEDEGEKDLFSSKSPEESLKIYLILFVYPHNTMGRCSDSLFFQGLDAKWLIIAT